MAFLIRIEKAKKSFYLGKTEVQALRGIDLEPVRPGQAKPRCLT
jgi:hypothetical protein